MNAQLFDFVVRAIIFTFGTYIVTIILVSWTTFWPPGIQYLLMFICPYFTQRSLLQVKDYSLNNSFKLLVFSV